MSDTDQLLEAPRVKLDQIRTHPLNPRRNATADEEMVESIRRQGVLTPVMLAPATDGDGWILIDGHRRFDGATKAGVSDVPVNPRYDLVTEAQQVEVMAITGLQSELLSAIEEAAVYEQLTLLGFDAAAIAQSTGFSQARVKGRMKLNDLGEKARDSVHDGQLTIGDAEALLEFAGNPDATALLEAAIGTPNFRQEVYAVRGRIERQQARQSRVAELEKAGVPQVVPSAGHPGWVRTLDDEGDLADELPARGMHAFPWPGPDIEGTTRDEDFHIAAGCAGFNVPEGDYVDVRVYCLDPDSHRSDDPDEPDEDRAARAERESEWEKEQEQRAAESARRDAADAARREWLVAHFTAMFPTKSHQPLAAAAAVVMPFLVVDDGEALNLTALAQALGIDPDREGANYYDARTDVLASYAAGLQAETATKKLSGFAAVVVSLVAPQFEQDYGYLDEYDEVVQVLALWDWITAAGYKLTDVEVELRAQLESKLLTLSSDTEGGDEE